MGLNKITVEVAYALPGKQKIISLQVVEGTTIEQAIQQSGILQLFPEINLDKQKVGVFSQIKALDTVLKEGDRVEIYRPLTRDPKDKRRIRAASNPRR